MKQKTALYSFALPLAAGAILAGQPNSTVKQLTTLGSLTGTIFQIRDDELGVFGDSEQTGKPVGSDIKEGKKTLLHYYVMRHADGPERKRLQAIFGNQAATLADIRYVQRMMRKREVEAMVQHDIDTLASKAAARIDKLSLDPSGKSSLHALLDFCARRDA